MSVDEAEAQRDQPRPLRRALAGIAVSIAIGAVFVVQTASRGASASALPVAGIGAHAAVAVPTPVVVVPGPAPVIAPVIAPTEVPPAVAEASDWQSERPGADADEPIAVPVATIPMRGDEPLDSWYPTLADWAHPITGTSELVPTRRTRWFGAERAGVDRDTHAECGAGHCGVDLGGPRGTPVVAVAWGTVVRVEHSEMGRDGRSGRYVRIEHPDQVYTQYMHLDAIADGLELGDEVEQGQVIGSLGRSGIVNGEAHVHFTLQAVVDDQLLYIDPVPFLARAHKVVIGSRRVPLPAL